MLNKPVYGGLDPAHHPIDNHFHTNVETSKHEINKTDSTNVIGRIGKVFLVALTGIVFILKFVFINSWYYHNCHVIKQDLKIIAKLLLGIVELIGEIFPRFYSKKSPPTSFFKTASECWRLLKNDYIKISSSKSDTRYTIPGKTIFITTFRCIYKVSEITESNSRVSFCSWSNKYISENFPRSIPHKVDFYTVDPELV